MPQDDAIARLARQIETAHRDERLLADADAVAAVRRRGGIELHRICAEFVSAVNRKLPEALLDLSPATYSPEMFREEGANLIQISSQGRQLQIAFETTPQMVSTEKFLIPYTLEGEVRAYNQKMLERFEVRNLSLFFCIEKDAAVWRYYDWRTLRTGLVDSDLFASLMGPLFS